MANKIITEVGKKTYLVDEAWDDARFPLTGERLDTSTGRLDYNFFNGAVGFAANARYPEEPISMVYQSAHSRKYGVPVRPHLHWYQQSANEPNWLLAYKIIKQGDPIAVETDYSNHTLVIKDSNVFPYTSGTIMQLTNFPEITIPSDDAVSTAIHFVLFRDSANTSTLFAGTDPSAIEELGQEFDLHFYKDALGSRQEFSK